MYSQVYKIAFFCIIHHLYYSIRIAFYIQFSFYAIDMFRIIRNRVKKLRYIKIKMCKNKLRKKK